MMKFGPTAAYLTGSQLRPLLSVAGQKGFRSLPPDVTAYIDRLKKDPSALSVSIGTSRPPDAAKKVADATKNEVAAKNKARKTKRRIALPATAKARP